VLLNNKKGVHLLRVQWLWKKPVHFVDFISRLCACYCAVYWPRRSTWQTVHCLKQWWNSWQ